MSAATPTRFRPDSRILLGLAWRAALVVAAAAAVAAELPPFARSALSLAAALVTVVFFLRRRRRAGLVEGVLTVVGVAIVGLALLGLVLNVLPSGLTAVTWGIAVGAFELVVLIALAFWRPPAAVRPSPLSRLRPASIVWTLLIAAVLSAALVWSVDSFTNTHVAPVALAGVISGDSMVVTVSSGSSSGPYELILVTGAGSTVLARDIRVGPGESASVTVHMPRDARETVELVEAGNATSLRELILDTRTSEQKATG